MIIKTRIVLPFVTAAISVALYLFLSRPAEPDKTELELYFRASRAYELADFPVCIELTNALSRGNPGFYQAGLLKAKAEYFSEHYEDAETTLRKLLDKTGNYHEAEIWFLRCLVQLERIDAAAEYGEDLLSRSPEDPRVLGVLASLAVVNDDFQKAIEYRNRAALFEEELALNRIELAKIYSDLLNPRLAARQLERAVPLLPDSSPLKPAVAELLERMENVE